MSEASSAIAKFDRRIVEGSLSQAVWRLAWPTMVQNVIAGLQGIIDQAMVDHYVGVIGNAAVIAGVARGNFRYRANVISVVIVSG